MWFIKMQEGVQFPIFPRLKNDNCPNFNRESASQLNQAPYFFSVISEKKNYSVAMLMSPPASATQVAKEFLGHVAAFLNLILIDPRRCCLT